MNLRESESTTTSPLLRFPNAATSPLIDTTVWTAQAMGFRLYFSTLLYLLMDLNVRMVKLLTIQDNVAQMETYVAKMSQLLAIQDNQSTIPDNEAIHTHLYVYDTFSIHLLLYIYMHTYIHVIYVCLCVCVCVCVYVCVCMLCACVCVSIHTHTHSLTHNTHTRLSGTSGLASNPANRQIASSSGASGSTTKKKSRFFYFFEKYDLTRPKVSKYSLTS
jgi:hypothetical protein